MKIGKKTYYDKITGNVIQEIGEREGSVRETTIEEDFQSYMLLSERVLNTVGSIQLEYGQFREMFSKYPYHIDITKNPIDGNAIVWDTDNPIGANLSDIQTSKIAQMSDFCEQEIVYAFHSSCLGEDHLFDCSRDDQTYMLGLVAKATLLANNIPMVDITLDWKFQGQPICYPFSVEQVLMLGGDLYTHLTACKKQYERLRMYINSLTNIQDVNAVTWNTIIPN
jgi:hypothetical protein